MHNPNPKAPTEHQFNRACDACRSHKVRCLPNNSEISKACQRCSKTGRECVFTAPQKRKQRKRTDTRVAELEREVEAMRSLFTGTKEEIQDQYRDQSQVSSIRRGFGDGKESVTPAATEIKLASEMAGVVSSPRWNSPGGPYTSPGPTIPASLDVVDRGIISLEQAKELFRVYNDDLVQYFPAVVFPAELTAQDLRRTRPTLFLAVIAAAAGKTDSSLYSILNSEVISLYVHSTVNHGEKSFELVQAMIITSIWYFPPGKFSQMKFYEYIHMATTMALDIGLGTNPRGSRSRRAGQHESESEMSVMADGELERRRTFLICYLIATGASVGTRRPNMLRYNRWIAECVETLDNSPKTSPYDKAIVGWVKLMNITEDIHSSFSFDDPSEIVNLEDFRTQLKLNGFEKTLDAWMKEYQPDGNNDALSLVFYHTQVYLHEIAIHDDHPPEDYNPPFKLDKVLSINTDSQARSTHLDATTAMVVNAHNFLDVLLRMSVDGLRSLPVANFARMAYCCIVLTQLYISSKSPTSKIGSVLDSESLKLLYYLDCMIKKLDEAVGSMECRAPYTFLGLLTRLRVWYKSQENDEFFSRPAQLLMDFDVCWLPPVPVCDLSEKSSGVNGDRLQFQYGASQHAHDEMDVSQALDPASADQIQFNGSPHGNPAIEPGDQLFMYGDLWAFDPTNTNWLPDLDISGVSDNEQVPQNFDWVLQPL